MIRSILTGLAVSITFWSIAQAPATRVYRAQHVVFYGLDFTFMKFIHSDGFVDKNNDPMCNTLTFKYFNEWNEMFLIEKSKYNLTDHFGVPDYAIDLEIASERNKAYPFQADCITNDDSYTIPQSELSKVVQSYGVGGDGIGLVAFVESMSKANDKCVIHSVFFDRADGTVLLIDRGEGPPSGIGFRNYWANGINNAMYSNSGKFAKARKAAK